MPRRCDFGHQAECSGQVIQLKMRLQMDRAAIDARAARTLGNRDPARHQWLTSAGLRARVDRGVHVAVQPGLQPLFNSRGVSSVPTMSRPITLI